MNRLLFSVPAALLLLAVSAVAQSVQFEQTALLYSATNASITSGYLQTNTYERGVNYRSGRGVPLSNTSGTPTGSDGRGFATQTPNQFRGMVVYGAVTRPPVANRPNLVAGQSLAANADNLNLSRATNNTGTVLVILRSAQVGAPYLSRAVSFLFGAIISPPATTESGAVAATNYWRSEPYTTIGHAGAGYYWSPHAGVPFAAQAGPLYVTWIKQAGSSNQPAGTDGVNWVNQGGLYYVLTNAAYVVSGAPVKTPRKLYWTESVFRAVGKPVTVPAARVSAVKVAYNNVVPERVTTEYVAPGQTSVTASTNTLQELRTIWHDHQQGQIFAYNREGRVFLELLGDSTSGETRQHLGFEIVDVTQQAIPVDLTVELGEKIMAYADGSSDATLLAEPIQAQAGSSFLHRHVVSGTGRIDYYAAQETTNLNDVLVHWLEPGAQGLNWPLIYTRYQQVWPTDVTRYSHYVRPLVATEAAAKLTAVKLPTENVPTIQYQDPLDFPRGKLSESFAYYSFLSASQPAHRALLRFTAGDQIAFERVFSWLDVNLKTPALFTNTLATNLSAWNPVSSTFNLTGPAVFQAPRVIAQTVEVGSRINAPTDESGINLAGFILQTNGNAFHPVAYKDPFVSGFDTAQSGAIIPVNAIPGTNNLDVWWFRPNATNGVRNLVNGFKAVHWPAVIARYTLAWPAAPSEIVLARNDGSGPLNSLQAVGTIYVQNDPALPGYNPNEEHALMLGGQAYALRDDLNLTAVTTPAVLSGAGTTFSSQPFVLLDYTESDGRPAMRAFKVLREKPASGVVFDYAVTAGGNRSASGAGAILQAPMPLPFLPAPVEYVTNGTIITKVNYNTEPSANSGDLPPGWTPSLTNTYPNYARFTYRDRKDNFWVLRGLHAGLPTLQAGSYNTNTRVFSTNLPAATAIVGSRFTNTFHVSRPSDSLVLTLAAGSPDLPSDLNTIAGLTLIGEPSQTSSNTYTFVITDTGDGTSVTNTLSLKVLASGTVTNQSPLAIISTNFYAQTNVTYVGRPPFLASAATNTNSFTMRYYYKTQAGFAWPGAVTSPAVGAIVPYLRPAGSTANPADKATPALDIVYRPVWPGDPPQLRYGETLMTAKNNLPAVRGQSSVELLYQQAIAQTINAPTPAVVLHDPTREKTFLLKTNSNDGLAALPGGVLTDSYQGRTYFPNLPPHLAERFYLDPNRGPKGALVFKGEYKDEVLGEKYVLLNVLRGSDLAAVKGLCPATDSMKPSWDAAVDGLATTVETFYENPSVPGQFIVNPSLTTTNLIGTLTEVPDANTAVDSLALSASGPGQGYVTLIAGNGGAFTAAGDPVSVYVLRVMPQLFVGEMKVLANANPLSEAITFQHTADLGGRFDEYEYEWKINPPVGGLPPVTDTSMSLYQPLTNGLDIARYTLGGSGIQGLVDNYIVMRYRPKHASHPLKDVWSDWTTPQLAEGWIKRVLAKINPFGQRVTDLYNNTVNSDASVLTAAGKRWEGDIALNMDTINNYGLIEIYETLLRRGRGLSIDAGINFGPANDALLLAAGYLNDLYMLVGNEAYADAANPTIGIGTKDQTYGDIATALFAFKGQVPSLLEEELGLLRGRDDFLQPGATTSPVYNRFVWNYTRGIDAGEVIYALNYNILDQNADGVVDAADAAKLYPQGHGDAYGHYLTAVKGYYSLLMNTNFDWVPRSEAVTVLGKAVQVDYLDERKFAAAAAAVARTGRQVFDLTWRKDYQPGQNAGWEHLATNRANTTRVVVLGTSTNNVVREWGADQWASRTGQGSLFSWVIGNAMLPEVDPDPTHEGIQKIDRTTVPELRELADTGASLQTALDNAEGRLTPLGLAAGSLAFDINPNQVTGSAPQTHFEQVYARAKAALNNAIISFDDAKDVTRLMRSEEDSLADFAAGVARQELAYTNALIELYGTPYPDDIGAGKTFQQGFEGPDLLHYMYVDDIELIDQNLWSPNQTQTFKVDIQTLPADWASKLGLDHFVVQASDPAYKLGTHYIEYQWGSHGFFGKPTAWTGKRKSPGKLQQSISEIIAAHNRLYNSLGAVSDKEDLDKAIQLFEAKVATHEKIRGLENDLLIANETLRSVKAAAGIFEAAIDAVKETADEVAEAAQTALPTDFIVGAAAAGGDATAPARGAIKASKAVTISTINALALTSKTVTLALETATETAAAVTWFNQIAPAEWELERKGEVVQLGLALRQVQAAFIGINAALRERDDAQRAYQAALAQGERIQAEREVFRQRAAAVIQGFRTRDAAFRIFRNEKLERYKSLFDLAARYSYLAANAYDYETGLLGTDTGKSFLNRIINARALGVVKNGEPQYAGSNTGDPGLSSTLAEMKADWDVLKGRLGFNNPDAYGTTVSLRTENLRILPGADGLQTWQDVLQQGRMDNLLDDVDVRRHCLQIDPGTGLPVPGIVLTFSTTIAPGQNLFGQGLAAGDSTFNRSTFATKLFAVGVALEGYRGMNNPAANGSVITYAGGTSPADPSLSYLDPLALAATPYVYLIPVGVDSMRSPPLGDASTIRSWNVQDVTIPLPFNIGASDFSTKQLYQSADSLTEPLFGLRKHQAFRPVSSTTAFSPDIYGLGSSLQPSQFTNRRLIGRSVWNSKWKLVIPGDALLNDPKEGLNRFIQTVTDVKLHLITYGYSGN